MNSLAILAVVLCCGTVLVDADFWVEFRAQTPQTSASRPRRWGFGRSRSSSSSRSSTANFLYECKGHPAGRTAFVANESRCRPVTSYSERVNIHMTCNFYSVYRPRLQGQTVNFSDHRRAFEEVIWYVGYKNDAIDHPNFAPALGEDLTDFMATVQQMGLDSIVPQEAVHGLAQHLAMTNVVRISGQPDLLYAQLQAYTSVLYRVTHFYDGINENGTTEQKEQLKVTMKALLKKMTDPCALMPDDNRIHVAAQMCGFYCSFMHIVSRQFGPTSHRCAGLAGGFCSGQVCTCFPDELEHPFQGCPMTPMQFCNNEVRTILNLFNP